MNYKSSLYAKASSYAKATAGKSCDYKKTTEEVMREIEILEKQNVSLASVAGYFLLYFNEVADSYDFTDEDLKEKALTYDLPMAYSLAHRIINHPTVKKLKNEIEQSIDQAEKEAFMIKNSWNK